MSPQTESTEELDVRHRSFAVDCFNACWTYIDKADRSEDDDEEMCRLAEVSFWHWSRFSGCTPKNRSIGYWQLARVYALCGKGDQALGYAGRCVRISEDTGLDPFYQAYGYEAMARALNLVGDITGKEKALRRARSLEAEISDTKNRQQLAADLATIS